MNLGAEDSNLTHSDGTSCQPDKSHLGDTPLGMSVGVVHRSLTEEGRHILNTGGPIPWAGVPN